MAELGEKTEFYHREIAKHLLKIKFSFLITTGNYGKLISDYVKINSKDNYVVIIHFNKKHGSELNGRLIRELPNETFKKFDVTKIDTPDKFLEWFTPTDNLHLAIFNVCIHVNDIHGMFPVPDAFMSTEIMMPVHALKCSIDKKILDAMEHLKEGRQVKAYLVLEEIIKSNITQYIS